MKLPLAYYGDPVLRKKAEPVKEINDEIRKLIADMEQTLKESGNGIGIAAPQVHRSLRLFITRVPKDDEEEGILRVFINPKILSYSEDNWVSEEGCLSIPKLYAPVIRPLTVTVEATDLEGNQFIGEYTGMEARCILHENDHINGVLYIDRVYPSIRKSMEPKLREIKKKYQK